MLVHDGIVEKVGSYFLAIQNKQRDVKLAQLFEVWVRDPAGDVTFNLPVGGIDDDSKAYSFETANDRSNLCLMVERWLRFVADANSTQTPLSDSQRFRHNDDYRDCTWNGERYTFTPTQAACVKALWQAFENGTPEVGQQRILEDAGSESTRLKDVFKSKGKPHPAWGTMIVKGQTAGSYCLVEPQRITSAGSPALQPSRQANR